MDVEKQEMTKSNRRIRKKIWQLASSYHCSIIGVCLGRKELRQLKNKKMFGFDSSLSDYLVHNKLSSLTPTKSPQSRALHKLLDTKYRLAVKRYSVFSIPGDMEKQWEQDCKEGAIAGSYWAIMTHPNTNNDLVSRIYGDCHMVSYDGFSIQKRENQVLTKYRQENNKLKGRLENKQEELCTEQEKRSAELGKIKHDRSELIRQRMENERLRKSNEELMAKLSTKTGRDELAQLKSHLHIEREKGRCLELQVETLNEECRSLKQSFDSLSMFTHQQEEEILEAKKRNDEQQDEIESLELILTAQLKPESGCNDCGDGCACPMNKELGGKTVLYVGGQHKMVPHYRQMVESYGAEFLHHDGGKESSRHILPKLLSGADAVFCPIDCISHDACKCVKKICKRYSKPFVMMRSSGLSSFAKSLSEIHQ